MGEAPALFVDDSNGFALKSKGLQTETTIGDKTYVIAGTDDEPLSRISIRIFNRSTGEWIVPVVLGTKPKHLKEHSAVIVNDDRILIVKEDATPDDSLWFLELDTQFVRQHRQSCETDVVAWSKGVTGDSDLPIVISGPSGVGKGTLITKLMNDFPAMFGFSVSHTTRAPRNKENNGIHYHFTDRTVMEKDIKNGKFLEFASVHGNLYGTSMEAVEVVADSGKRCILDIDVQGARSVRASSLEAIFIFVCPPSFEELEKRLRERGTETEEQIQKRLRNAKTELEQGQSPGLFDHILVNDDLDSCYENLKNILGLGVNNGTATRTSPKHVDQPLDNSPSEKDQKILVNCGTGEVEKSPNQLSVLDLSSIKGGAPGRTRGLSLYASDLHADVLDGIKQLN